MFLQFLLISLLPSHRFPSGRHLPWTLVTVPPRVSLWILLTRRLLSTFVSRKCHPHMSLHPFSSDRKTLCTLFHSPFVSLSRSISVFLLSLVSLLSSSLVLCSPALPLTSYDPYFCPTPLCEGSLPVRPLFQTEIGPRVILCVRDSHADSRFTDRRPKWTVEFRSSQPPVLLRPIVCCGPLSSETVSGLSTEGRGRTELKGRFGRLWRSKEVWGIGPSWVLSRRATVRLEDTGDVLQESYTSTFPVGNKDYGGVSPRLDSRPDSSRNSRSVTFNS